MICQVSVQSPSLHDYTRSCTFTVCHVNKQGRLIRSSIDSVSARDSLLPKLEDLTCELWPCYLITGQNNKCMSWAILSSQTFLASDRRVMGFFLRGTRFPDPPTTSCLDKMLASFSSIINRMSSLGLTGRSQSTCCNMTRLQFPLWSYPALWALCRSQCTWRLCLTVRYRSFLLPADCSNCIGMKHPWLYVYEIRIQTEIQITVTLYWA